MTPAIDGDILLHELGWSGQFKDKETGEEVLLSFDHVEELLNDKIDLICREVDATEDPIIFLTDTEWLAKKQGRHYTPNFRYHVAVTKPYKGTRKNPKPFHFYNIMVYLIANYNTVVSTGGIEADDEMCIYANLHPDTIICSRDKDLRINEGWHYSWECGRQRSVGPYKTDRVGLLTKGNNGKTLGYGQAFFYYQMLVGDTADNIPGLPGIGDAKALVLLEECETEVEYYKTVKAKYKEVMEEGAKEYFFEQANLLHMIQERGGSYGTP